MLLGIVFFALGFNGGLTGVRHSARDADRHGHELGGARPPAQHVVIEREAAMALTPIALIPQVVLGGLMVPMTTNPLLEYPMYVMPARWGFQGLVARSARR